MSVLSSTPSRDGSDNRKKKTKKGKRKFTLSDLRKEIQKNPSAFLPEDGKGKSKYRRSRKRVENPQQQYLYAKQRKADARESAELAEAPVPLNKVAKAVPVSLAKEYGLTNPGGQHSDPLVDEVEPEILGQLRVGEELKSSSYVYVINKPAGWSIFNSNKKAARTEEKQQQQSTRSKRKQATRLEIRDEDGSKDILEYTEADMLAVMTPEEIEEYSAEISLPLVDSEISKKTKIATEVQVNEKDGSFLGEICDELEMEERKLLSELTPDELELYMEEGGRLPVNFQLPGSSMKQKEAQNEEDEIPPIQIPESLDSTTEEVLSKIEARKSAAKSTAVASFSPLSRPSVVAWLKNLKTQEGSPMKGGKYWTALAGATDVDDSGVVVICPKDHVENVFVDYLEYVAVVGNGNYLASKPKGVVSIPKNEMAMDILSTLRRNRGEDTVQAVRVVVPDKFSSCISIIQTCQKHFQDGIRGDPAGNPLGRLGHRRLVHCNAVSVSSLAFDESVEAETKGLPDDIAILAERGNQHQYKQGSWVGRAALKNNPLTTAYREINGAADGFPGWTVDRYDKWLLVQHDETFPRGPLPSIHDGNTAGIYYLPADPDRSAMGSSPGADSSLTRPRLLEGQPAPESFSIFENGITYHVSLDKDLSTGIFLDQRPQRAWLSQNCNKDTHVLNCFAHCGGFSVAAATAGASTTSVDMNKKWLDRVEPQLKANGVNFDVRHDCIYGDCFDWLTRLAKRGEKYDIVILDPPSASVGRKKKKRWSIKSDMPELVALAAKVVKKGGLLWTTTNSASVSPLKFARLCRRGLEDAGFGSAKLERIQPMPHDFPTIGPQPVKNYVWRLP